MYTKFLLTGVLLLVFLSVNAQLFNSVSQNGFTNDTTGVQYKFEGQAENNCLENLGLRNDIQPVNWDVSFNQQDHALVISSKQDQPQPADYWYMNNFFCDSACKQYGQHKYAADLSENLSISYRVKSNVALNSFSIAAMTWYWGRDYYGAGGLPIYPTISLQPDEWKIVDFDLCINSNNWEEVTSTLSSEYGKSLIESAIGFTIRIDDPILKTNRDVIIEIDYILIGAAAGECPIVTTGVSKANSNTTMASLFPNPFHDYLQLPAQPDIAYVEILTINQELLMKIENNFDQKIQTSTLIPGIYLIRYHLNNGSIKISKAIKN